MGGESLSDQVYAIHSLSLTLLLSHSRLIVTPHSAPTACYRNAINYRRVPSPQGSGAPIATQKELNSPVIGLPLPSLPSIDLSPQPPNPSFVRSPFFLCAPWPIPTLLSTSISSLIAPAPLESHEGRDYESLSNLFTPVV